jgi:hypothetical protein
MFQGSNYQDRAASHKRAKLACKLFRFDVAILRLIGKIEIMSIYQSAGVIGTKILIPASQGTFE